MNKFSIIQNTNGFYYIQYNMESTYYLGCINPEYFDDELRENYLNIIEEAIKHFNKESNNQPNIMSFFEYADGEKNNFIITFEIKNCFINIQRLIKIEVTKYIKNINYYNNLDIIINEQQNIIKNQNLIIKEHTCKIETLEINIINIINNFNKLKLNFEIMNTQIQHDILDTKFDDGKYDKDNKDNKDNNIFYKNKSNINKLNKILQQELNIIKEQYDKV